MKHLLCIIVALMYATVSHACMLRTVINDSFTTDILIRRTHIPVPGRKNRPEGTHILHRTQKMDSPRVVDAHTIGLGEYLDLVVSEKTSYGHICKEYRITPDHKNKKVILQKKDGCQVGRLSYETIEEIPMDPHACYVDVYLKNDVNSLSIKVLTDLEEPIIVPAAKKLIL